MGDPFPLSVAGQGTLNGTRDRELSLGPAVQEPRKPRGAPLMADQASVTASTAGTIDVGGDLTVNRLGFGAMRLTGRGIWGEPPDRDQAKAVLRRAVELGVNFIDIADSYDPAVSGTLIAEALYPYPDDLVIATKGGLERPGPGRWRANGRPVRLVLVGHVAGQVVAGRDLPAEAGGHFLVAAGMVGAVVAPGSPSADVLLMCP
jgi:Aldo/keto reductase family